MSWFGFGEVEEEDPNAKKLIVELYGGRDIIDAKANKKDETVLYDIFCTLTLGKQKYQTEIIKSSRNPTWDTTFEFLIDNCLDSAVIVISCYHSGLVTNTFLGEIRIPIREHKDIALNLSSQHWFPLFNPKLSKKDGYPGELGMKIGAMGGDIISKKVSEYGELIDDRSAEEIFEEAASIALEGNNSVKRSLRLAEQTKQMQHETLVNIKGQGHQIERMQDDLYTIDNNIKQSKRKLRSIESFTGTLANTFTSSTNKNYEKKAKQDKQLFKKRNESEKKNKKIKQAQWEERRAADKLNSRKKRDAMINRTPGKREIESGSQEEKFYQIMDNTESELESLSCVLDDIKNISLDVNVELQQQNERLYALQHDMDKAGRETDKAIKRSRAILKA